MRRIPGIVSPSQQVSALGDRFSANVRSVRCREPVWLLSFCRAVTSLVWARPRLYQFMSSNWPEGRNPQRPVVKGHGVRAPSSGPERSNERVSERPEPFLESCHRRKHFLLVFNKRWYRARSLATPRKRTCSRAGSGRLAHLFESHPRGLTQGRANAILGIKQPHVSALMRNCAGNFSVGRLIEFSHRAARTSRSR
jgi:hypothetical protein